MSTYTAVIGDTSSVGSLGYLEDPALVAGVQTGRRRNGAVAAARINTVIAPHIIMDSVGGFISADFVIPPEEAQLWRPMLRYGSVCWLFDGQTPIFHGYCEKPTWDTDGSALMNISGAFLLLGRSMMREAWDMWDMTAYNKGVTGSENKNSTATINSDGTLTLAMPTGTVAAGDKVSVNYFLFGEAVGGDDAKLLTAFEFSMTSQFGLLSAGRSFQVVGKTTPSAGGTVIWAGSPTPPFQSDKQGAADLNVTNQTPGAWGAGSGVNGYRCLEFQYLFGNAVTLTTPNYITFDRIRVGTREAVFQPLSGGVPLLQDTASIARDMLTMKGATSNHDIPQEFWPSGTKAGLIASGAPFNDVNSFFYSPSNTFGMMDPRFPLSSAPNSGFGITGFNALGWQTPADILTSLAAIDNCHVGFYLPYGQRGGYDAAGNATTDSGSSWLSAPPQLYYQAFPDPISNPDYTIQTREGAVVDQNTDTQPLIDQVYVNYQTLQGRQLSMVVNDPTPKNYLYAQGFRRAEDYTFEAAIGDFNSPALIGAQMLASRRNPYPSAQITIENDGAERYPILKRGGGQVPKLAEIRPGSVHITDMPAAGGLRAGYATSVEWWGQTLTQNEKVQITLGAPGMPSRIKQTLGKVIQRHQKRRHNGGPPR